ncbi:MAG: helix-turn-helix transcriptional regulator [Bauldia sp.]|nr:helix-turn-helix transcriptional regulator [Bauldia sp.]
MTAANALRIDTGMNAPLPIIDATVVKAIRAHFRWSQERLAEELGCDQATVSRAERGSPITGPVRKLLETHARKVLDEGGTLAPKESPAPAGAAA